MNAVVSVEQKAYRIKFVQELVALGISGINKRLRNRLRNRLRHMLRHKRLRERLRYGPRKRPRERSLNRISMIKLCLLIKLN